MRFPKGNDWMERTAILVMLTSLIVVAYAVVKLMNH